MGKSKPSRKKSNPICNTPYDQRVMKAIRRIAYVDQSDDHRARQVDGFIRLFMMKSSISKFVNGANLRACEIGYQWDRNNIMGLLNHSEFAKMQPTVVAFEVEMSEEEANNFIYEPVVYIDFSRRNHYKDMAKELLDIRQISRDQVVMCRELLDFQTEQREMIQQQLRDDINQSLHTGVRHVFGKPLYNQVLDPNKGIVLPPLVSNNELDFLDSIRDKEILTEDEMSFLDNIGELTYRGKSLMENYDNDLNNLPQEYKESETLKEVINE